jgi:DNA repair protein RadA/Sms
LDFAVCAALVSSLLDIPLSNRCCFVAEIGLGGELRPVAGMEARLAEARKLGFDKIVLSSHQGLDKGTIPDTRKSKGLRILPLEFISDWTATLASNQNTKP